MGRVGCHKGFTLLELLLTMGILVLIVGIMGTTFRLAIRSWEKGEEHVEAFRRTRIVMDLLAQQLKSFYPYMVKDKNTYHIAFEGEASSLKFVSPLSLRHYLVTGLKWVHYYIEEDGENGKTLFVQESTVTGEDFLEDEDGKDLQDGEAVSLFPGLEDLTFEYYVVAVENRSGRERKNGEEKEGEWLTQWSWEDTEEKGAHQDEVLLLKAIRVTITQKTGHEGDGEPITTAMTIPLVAAPTQESPLGPIGSTPFFPGERGGFPVQPIIPPGGFGGSGHDELPF